MNRWFKIAGGFLLLFLVGYLYQLGTSVKDLRVEIQTMRERQSLTWYNQMIFEGRVRGLENSTFVVIGHSDSGTGNFVTIGTMAENMGIGPYGANTYVNVDASEPLTVILRNKDGNVIDAAVLGQLDPGDLVVAWYSDNPTAEETSPDDWRLQASYWTEKGLVVAIEHFTGGTD